MYKLTSPHMRFSNMHFAQYSLPSRNVVKNAGAKALSSITEGVRMEQIGQNMGTSVDDHFSSVHSMQGTRQVLLQRRLF